MGTFKLQYMVCSKPTCGGVYAHRGGTGLQVEGQEVAHEVLEGGAHRGRA
jgi:hypothetical protein